MKVAYKRKIEGVSTWGIIHNSGFFLANIPVFEDGSIDCWGLCDLDEIKEKLDIGWLVTQVPIDKTLGIYDLGSIQIQNSDFVFDQESYYQYLYQTVKQMNNTMEGLYVKTKEINDRHTQTKEWIIALQYPIKRLPWQMHEGRSTKVFEKLSDELYQVININCYADHTFMLSSQDGIYLTYEEISELFEKGNLTAEISGSAWFVLGDMGKVFGQVELQVGNKNKLIELAEIEKEVCKEKTLKKECQELYTAFLQRPSERLRQALKTVYEQMPEHERCGLGDMDSKDGLSKNHLSSRAKKRGLATLVYKDS